MTSGTSEAAAIVTSRRTSLRNQSGHLTRQPLTPKWNDNWPAPVQSTFEERVVHLPCEFITDFFTRKDGKPLMFAGVWDYSDVKSDVMPSFAILTDEPNELVAPYHDRMPVVLDDVEPGSMPTHH